MIIKTIVILNFKNIKEIKLIFSPKINFFFGKNGMGKTNLLDSLYYLAFTKNRTNLADSQLISNNKNFAILHAFYKDEKQTEEIHCVIRRNQRKIFKRNCKKYDKFSEHIGLIPTVMLSPVDIDIIQSGSNERKKFVDILISQYDKEYLLALIRYNRALRQRNFLLKHSSYLSNEEFEMWEEQMVIAGEIIYKKRKNFVVDFLPLLKKYYYIIGRENEIVNLEYISQLDNCFLCNLLCEKRERDRVLGFTSTGIHKDDFNFLLNNRLIRKIGSQGQNKTYLIALKLAKFDFLIQKGSSVPILLLDDLFDNLDAERVEKIIHLANKFPLGQIFITGTNYIHLKNISAKMRCTMAYKFFFVKNGSIKEIL